MLTEVDHSVAVRSVPISEQLGVAQHDARHLTQGGHDTLRPSSEGCREIREQPRPAETAATHDDPVDTGTGDHAKSVVGLPDVTVAEHWDDEGLLETGDRGPVRGA